MKSISNFFFNRNQLEVSTERSADVARELLTSENAATAVMEVIELSISEIEMNPFQPRKIFSDEGLAELASSIREFGVISPLIVRKTERGHELIAGERRLRASLLAGLAMVPCIVRGVDDKEMAEIALIENLQREDLHYFEEAAGYEKLLTQFSMTQDVLASRVGKDQSTIANKLRLLKLAPEVRDFIYRERLTERHSRALLKIDDVGEQLNILNVVVESKMNVRETEALIAEKFQVKEEPQKAPKRSAMMGIVKDVRIFINTVGELVKQMKKAGLDVRLTQEQDEHTVTITMVVPKRR